MKIAVMGAGAVGCYYGGMLARAGHDVVLIGRAAHVDAIERTGLRLDMSTFSGHVAARASISPSAVAQCDVLLFCVKSSDTASAGAAIAPHLSAETVVLSLQNGVDNADRLAAVIGRPVIPAVVYVAAAMAGNGHVKHHGRGELVIGDASDSTRIADVLTASGIPVTVSDNVKGALWAKLIVNCAFNAVSALTQRTYGDLISQPGVMALLRDVVDECLAVAVARGVRVPDDPWTATQRIAESMAGQRSSTAQDLARGKRTEIDYLNGFIVQEGAAAGVATPVNHALHTLVRLTEDGALATPAMP